MEQKIKIQAIGAPFDLRASSCADIKPSCFEWTDEDCSIKVFIDGGILSGLDYSKKPNEKKIAWICESRSIFHLLHMPLDVWKEKLGHISSCYDYVFVSDRQWCGLYPNIKFCFAGSNFPWIKIPKFISRKEKLVSMVASPKQYTEGHKLRHKIAEKYKNRLDLFGGACDSPRFGNLKAPWEQKHTTVLPYMFSIVVENDSYETYFTEKLTDCFASGTIPVYWGSPDISKYFNSDGIINLTDEFDIDILNEELYYSKINAIRENYFAVKKMKIADDVLFGMIYEN